MADPETTKPTEIDKELAGLTTSLNMLSACEDLLSRGHFNYQDAKIIPTCKEYLTKCHEMILERCLEHPQADQIKTLKELKDARAKAKEDKAANASA